MKKLICFMSFFGLLLSMGLAQSNSQINWARISESLEAKMKETPEDEYIQVSIIMYDQLDLESMMSYFRTERVPLERRAKQVITSLQAKAAATQPQFISYLNTVNGVESGSIRSLWISNEIQVRVNKAGISALSLRSEIDYLYFQYPYQRLAEEKVESLEASLYTPNGHEPGHDVMNVPGLWALGYTGTNRRLFMIDEGVDLRHPALFNNYRGLVDGNSVSYFDPAGTAADTVPSKCVAFGDHGTLVLGTVVGNDFSRRDTIGIAPDALWMSSPLALGDGQGGVGCQDAAGDYSFALQWALDPDGDPNTVDDMPDVINMSFGNSNFADCTDPRFQQITALEAAGVGVIIAAGNAGPNASTVGPPANGATNLVNTFAVGSVTQASNIASFSSRGPGLCSDDGASLEIKPEVVAPGVTIRTTSNGDAYANVQGTSFSAPYVAGLFLLLKEAFPTLSGEEIKLGIYNSATDLGILGEDNNYGNGLVDAVAAFNYLVNQGNTPVPRNPDADGLLHNLNDLNSFACAKDVVPSFLLENSGTSTMTAATINYTYSNGITGTINWTGSLTKNRTERIVLPAESLPAGNYSLSIELVQVNGKTEYSVRDNAIEESFSIFDEVLPTVVTTNPVACTGGAAVIEANTGGSDREVVWYDAATGGDIVGIGSPFITPDLSQNTTFYAEAMKVANAGLPDLNAGQSFASISDDSYLEFDALNDLEIRSVKVYAASAGIRRVAVNNFDGTLVGRSAFLNLQAGENIIELNVSVPQGTGYRMEQVGQVDELFATVNGFSFPLEIPEVLTITGSNDGLYNFFYDWEVVSSFNCERVAQEVTVSPTSANAAFTPSRTVLNLANSGRVNFNNQSTGASSFFWDFGDGTTSTDQSPSHDYTLAGKYTVTLTVEAAGGCTDIATAEIEATGIVGIEEDLANIGELTVFPNPSAGNFVLDMDLLKREEVEIEIFDLPGRRIWSRSADTYLKDRVEMDLSSANKGIYLLKVKIAGLTWVQKLVKE